MTYRRLTTDEIIQLGQELADVRRWQGARDYVSALYGLGAREPHGLPPHQVTILVESVKTWQASRTQYQDVVSVLVADVERRLLPYDLSRYWWSQFTLSAEVAARLAQDAIGKLEVAHTPDDDMLYQALRELCAEKIGVEFTLYDQPHDPITYTYLIDTPPSVSFAAVYVAEGENTR
ncbi:MAG TPA: hypothetical protein VMV29_17195 [Ktedonobacterales bacterium]|nr:hypothetical protein [Ktedonobacterales bacterium]